MNFDVMSKQIICEEERAFKTANKSKKQDCIPVGCGPPACCPYLPACTALGGGACLWFQGGACLWSRGVPDSGHGGCIPACNGADPPVNRMTDRCKKYYLAPNLVCGR